jgi:DnaK suppressor protein
MRKRDLERCRTLLVEQRERILGDVGRVLSAGELDVDPDDLPDEIDTAVAESSSSFTGQIRAREERLLAKIDRMLEKIGQGTYGECEGCGDEIGVKRLVARPVASLCIACKEDQERDERRRE